MKHTLNVLKVLAEETRLRILMALADQELCVCQIVAMLGLAASTTSKHLALMYQAGLIDLRKDGRWAYYRICPDWKKKNTLHQWLIEELAGSAKIVEDRKKLAGSLKVPEKAVCNPVESREIPGKPGVWRKAKDKDCC